MKKHEVPQDRDPSFEGHTKLCYAVDESGHYVRVQTSGWSTEKAVKDVAWAHIEKDLATTRDEVSRGLASPLKYFMKLRQMDPWLLAQNLRVWTWRVKWHLRPRVFRRLNETWLKRYAEALDVSVEELRGTNLLSGGGAL
jgi:hypothetical protein